MRLVYLGLATVAAGLVLAASAGSGGPPALQLTACPTNEFSGFPGGAIFPDGLRVDCGTLAVPENRSNPHSRMIRFGVAIVHAPNGHPRPDPIVFMDGGPSVGAVQEYAMFFYFAGASYVQDRDVILVDTRGEGVSKPYLSDPRLGCPELDQADFETFYAKPFIGSGFGPRFDDALRACRARLVADGVDLSAYNAAETAADLEALRKALGVKQWNLWAISADGVAGLTYMRLYPAGIRSAVLDSPQNPAMNIGTDYVRGAAAMFDRAFAGCAANAACAAKYPSLRDLFFAEMAQLQAHPQDVVVRFRGGQSITVHVDGVEFWFEMRDNLFQFDIQQLFSRVWDAAHGQLAKVVAADFGKDAPSRDDFSSDPYRAAGKTQSYVCHDIVNLIPQSVYQQAAADLPYLAPEILGHYFDHPVGPAGCAIWDNGVADAAQHQPVRSRIPTLITTSEFDMGVTPNIVEQIPPGLPNSFLYEFPATFHLQLASYNPVADCARGIAAQFLDAPAQRPDSSCIAALPGFDYTP